MPTFEEIYTQHADVYEQLVTHEDYQGNLLPTLAAIRPLAQLDVVEVGAGTGRLTLLLAPHVRSIVACDASLPMLTLAARKLRASKASHVRVVIADNQHLPLADASADLAIEGWSFGHATVWHAARWRTVVRDALAELRRVLRPGGTIVLLETLGTGQATSQAPTAELGAFYAWLEQEQGFTGQWLRTDYRFASRAQAETLTEFFFGTPMPVIEHADGQAVVAECTGVWWRST